MTKRLRDAAQAAVDAGDFNSQVDELQAALDEARQPVTVTEEQAINLIMTFHRAADGDEPTQAEVDGLSAEDKLEIVAVMAAVLEKARELGL